MSTYEAISADLGIILASIAMTGPDDLDLEIIHEAALALALISTPKTTTACKHTAAAFAQSYSYGASAAKSAIAQLEMILL